MASNENATIYFEYKKLPIENKILVLDANPSIPSNQLIALTIPEIQKIAIKKERIVGRFIEFKESQFRSI